MREDNHERNKLCNIQKNFIFTTYKLFRSKSWKISQMLLWGIDNFWIEMPLISFDIAIAIVYIELYL